MGESTVVPGNLLALVAGKLSKPIAAFSGGCTPFLGLDLAGSYFFGEAGKN